MFFSVTSGGRIERDQTSSPTTISRNLSIISGEECIAHIRSKTQPLEVKILERLTDIFMGLMTVRILIVDDSAIFREGLCATLEANADWEVCGEAVDGIEGIQKNRLLSPDLILMDLSMPRMSGIEAASQILREVPNVRILLLTLFLTHPLAQEARKIGIRATVSKAAMHHLVSGINAVLRGEEFTVPID